MSKNSTKQLEATHEGVFSLLDTDLYKLTMQCCVYKFYPKTEVTYNYTNRTPDMKFTQVAFTWLKEQIKKLDSISLTTEEYDYLQKNCPYLSADYLKYLKNFRFNTEAEVEIDFVPIASSSSYSSSTSHTCIAENDSSSNTGDIVLHVKGLWLHTILYEIPLLALISETYFRFIDTAWSHEGQVDLAYNKGIALLHGGCFFSEFGTRRRRDYATQAAVMQGLTKAYAESRANNWQGQLSGTSNVHFAMRFGVAPVGTVAHEWFMGAAAISDDYVRANQLALQQWVDVFGIGVLGVALTDTFGTKVFLDAFAQQVKGDGEQRSFAQVFTGVRQDSGDPEHYVKDLAAFYESQGIDKSTKTVVFSDSLNIEKCLRYKQVTEDLKLLPRFGIGTFFSNDYINSDSGKKSVPLNIVIKLSSANGNQAIKISDNIGKNTGDKATVEIVKRTLGYEEKGWKQGDEAHRWD